MKHINILEEAPHAFAQWLEDHQDAISNKIQDANVTGNHLWAYFKANPEIYAALKQKLLENQGFICCYCGQRIEKNHYTTIEHLLAKSTHKNLTLQLSNLLASCKGGSVNQIHIVEAAERLEDIATRFGVDIEHIEEVYVSIDEEALFRRRYDLENLSAGDRIVIFPKTATSEQHCDTKKGNNNIGIHPYQNDCQDKFAYDFFDGTIILTAENSSSIQILGLNSNKYLNRLRKKVIDDSILLKERLIEDFGDAPEAFETHRLQLIKQLNTPNKQRLDPFVFVSTWSLNN